MKLKLKYKFIALPYIIWLIIFIIGPLCLVCYFGLTDESGNITIENLSMVGNYASVLWRSILLALISTIITLVIAYPLSFILSRKKSNIQHILLMLFILPMWINFLLRTYGWMTLLENNGLINKFLMFIGLGQIQLINNKFAVIVGMVYNYLPFMILPLYSTMVKIDQTIIEAAQDLGAGTRRIFAKIIFPLSLPGINTGITMVFVPAVSTFIISKMLGGGSNFLIGDLIELQFLGNTYNPNLGSAIALVLMTIILMCMSFLNQFDNEGNEDMLL